MKINGISENEKIVLLNIFAGDFVPFKILRSQVNNLSVQSRRKAYHTYQAEFDFCGNQSDVLSGHEENIRVEDTYFQVEESPVPFYALATVMEGKIRWLQIGADFDFESDFSIKNFYWKIRNDDPLRQEAIVWNEQDRNFDRAISYIPTYK